MHRSRGLCGIVLAGSLLLAAVPVWAQLESFAIPHLFAVPTATTTRLLGMGGFVACISDAGFANPAFGGTLTGKSATTHLTISDFDGGLNLRAEQVSVAFPLHPDRDGIQLTGFRLRTHEDGQVETPAGVANLSLREDDLAVHYGRRLGRQWVAGVGVSPILRTDTYVTVPGTGDVLAHLHSAAKSGARLGGLYQRPDGGCAGFVWDYYREDVTGSGPFFGTGDSGKFISREIAVGASQPLSEKLLAAVEWQQLSSSGEGATVGDSGFRVGVEFRPTPDWALRVGDNDGAFSAGVGLQSQAWSFQYAYVKDLNSDLAEPTLGGSQSHSLEARYAW